MNKLVSSARDFNLKLDLRGQADMLRRQLEDQVVKKVRFTGSKELIQFATRKLQMTDLIDPFLDYQTIRL